jgi:hypothetical protein
MAKLVWNIRVALSDVTRHGRIVETSVLYVETLIDSDAFLNVPIPNGAQKQTRD